MELADIFNSVNDAINDPMSGIVQPVLDNLLSVEGALLTVGGASLLYSTSAMVPFFSCGKKNWLSGYGAWKKGLYSDPKKGITLGRYKGRLVCYTGDYHIGIDGTTGTGKTACAFLATLLMNENYSFIVFDQSGDLYKLTSGRRSQLGPVYYLKPGDVNSDFYNPFDDLPNDNRIITNIENMIAPLFDGSAKDQKKTGGDPFFDKNPRDIACFIVLHVLYGDDTTKKNMAGVLEFMSDEIACFREMAANPRHPQCRQVGIDMLAMSDPTRSSLVAVIKGAFSLWRDAGIVDMTSKSSFRIEELATSTDGPVTIYLGAPAIMLQRMMPFYVMIENMMCLHLMDNTTTTLSGKKRIWPLIIADDEAQDTKRANIDKFAIYRKYFIWGMFGYQSLHAMFDLYGEPKLSLFKLKMSHRPTVGSKDVQTISKMSGSYKKKEASQSESSSSKGGKSHSRSWKYVDKPRLTEADLEKLPEYGKTLLTHPGKPALLETFDAKADPEFKKLIVDPFVKVAHRVVMPTWENISRPIIRTVNDVPIEGLPQQPDNQIIMPEDPMQMILQMEGGSDAREPAEQPSRPTRSGKRKVIA